MKVAIVDFDETLITLDSLVYIMKKEKWYLRPDFLFLGGLIAFLSLFSKKTALKFRSALKKRILKKAKALSDTKKQKYIDIFKKAINTEVLEHIKSGGYDEVTIASAGERHIIDAVISGILPIALNISNNWDRLDDFETCYGTEKLSRVLAAYDAKSPDYYVYTDSMSDKPLMDIAKKTYFIENGKIKEKNL